MSYRSWISCFVASVGALLLVGGVASAVEVPITYLLPSGSTSTNMATITGAITSPISQSRTATTYAHGTIPANLTTTFNISSHAATVSGIGFAYNNPGTISFDNVSLHYSVIFIFNEDVNTYDLKATLLTPSAPGPVDPATGKFAVGYHQVELNQGRAEATGMTSFSVNFATEPARDWATGSDGTLSVSAASNPHGISIGSSGYQVTYDYTSQMIVPVHVVKDISNGTISGTATVDGTLTVPGSFSHTFNYLPGDANLDGTVDATDLNTVLSYYNAASGTEKWGRGDFNLDSITDATDLNTVLSYYNQTSAGIMAGFNSAAVPEPGSIVMLLSLALSLAGFGLWKRSR